MWIEHILDGLAGQAAWGYSSGTAAATEPTALAALALAGHRRWDDAKKGLQWLAAQQASDGSLGISDEQPQPGWPTGWGMLAWVAAQSPRNSLLTAYLDNIKAAAGWMLSLRGDTMPRVTEFGHDTTLSAWPWVASTHSWVEPTAINLLALKAAGYGNHPRCREAVRLLIDRLFPSGGCNYGNTVVLGSTLRPHVQPSGLALLALAGEADPNGGIERTISYLARSISPRTTSASLSLALLGLAAHGQVAADHYPHWLEQAAARTRRRDAAPMQSALIALAMLGRDSPIVLHGTTS